MSALTSNLFSQLEACQVNPSLQKLDTEAKMLIPQFNQPFAPQSDCVMAALIGSRSVSARLYCTSDEMAEVVRITNLAVARYSEVSVANPTMQSIVNFIRRAH